MKKRRKRRKHYNWIEEILKGNTDKFYHSTDFDIWREKVLTRDKNTCQFFFFFFNDGIHFPDKIKLVNENTAHHIIPIKERPDLALDPDNGVALSFEAHEIKEDRHRWTWRKKKKTLTEERW